MSPTRAAGSNNGPQIGGAGLKLPGKYDLEGSNLDVSKIRSDMYYIDIVVMVYMQDYIFFKVSLPSNKKK